MYVEGKDKRGNVYRIRIYIGVVEPMLFSDAPWKEVKSVGGKVFRRVFARIGDTFGFVYSDGEKLYRFDVFGEMEEVKEDHAEVDFKDWLKKYEMLVAARKRFDELVAKVPSEWTGSKGTKFKLKFYPDGDFDIVPLSGNDFYLADTPDEEIANVLFDYMGCVYYCRSVMVIIRDDITKKFPDVKFEVGPGWNIYKERDGRES